MNFESDAEIGRKGAFCKGLYRSCGNHREYKMDNDNSKADISKQELSVLSKALNKSVEYSRRSRYTWLTLLAGFLIGAGVATAIITLTSHDERKNAETEILLKRSQETLKTMKQIQSSIDQLTGNVRSIIEKNKINKPLTRQEIKPEEKQVITPPVKKNESEETQACIELGRYTVYIHYNKRKNKKIMEELSAFLKNKGYTVSEIEKVKDRKRDIRYFHDEDKEGALLFKRHICDFINRSSDIKDIDLKVRNLGEVYPHASRGLLELWIIL